MPNFVRERENTLTLSFNVDKSNWKEVYSKENVESFKRNLDAKGRELFINIYFGDGFIPDVYYRIADQFRDICCEMEVGIEIKSIFDLFKPVPDVSHCTYLLSGRYSFFLRRFMKKIKQRKGLYTLLSYIEPEDVDISVAFFEKLSKEFSEVEIVLHPESTEGVDQSLLETIRSEGYFASSKSFQTKKPERLRINYRYSDIELSPREIKTRDLNKFKNYRCYAGRENIFVDSSGAILPSACGHLSPLSASLGGGFNFSTKGYVCPAERCLQSDDILISKIEPEEASL